MTAEGPAPETRTWYDIAALVGDNLVPTRADWVVLHIRSSVLDTLRRSDLSDLAVVGEPVPGEGLGLVALRHGDADLEVALHGMVTRLTPRVGDPYGSGRVTATGRSRLATRVDPAHLRAIATGADNLRALQGLDLGSAVIAPVLAGDLVIGAVNLVRSAGGTVGEDDLPYAEDLGGRIGAALDAARPATARLAGSSSRTLPGGTTWEPPLGGNMTREARLWLRRMMPELVDRLVRADLADDLDLVVSEMVGNAVRHAGGVVDIRLVCADGRVHLAVRDGDDRPLTRRPPDATAEGGRGVVLIEALALEWGVEHDVADGGKTVWAEFAL